MISKIFPLTSIRFDIITELYVKPLRLKEIAKKIGKKIPVTHNTLKLMSNILDKDQNIYSLKIEFVVLFEKAIISYLLEKRLDKYYDILPYIKKFAKPTEMIFFGSYYRAEQTEKSDIDIFIISEVSNEDILKIQGKLSKLMKIEIQIVKVSQENHLTDKDKYSDLYRNILTSRKLGIKIPLEII